MALTDEPRVDTGDPEQPGALMRPLGLAALPPALRPFAVVSVGAIAGWGLALVLTAVGSGVQFDPRGFPDGLMGTSGVGPAFVKTATTASLAIALAAATAAVWRPGWNDTGWTRLGRYLVRLAVAVIGLRFLGLVAVHWGTLEPQLDETWGDRSRLLWGSGLGWSAMVAVVASLFLPSSGDLARRLAVPLAVLPVATWLVAELVKGEITRGWESNADWRADPLLGVIDSLQLMLVLFLVWEIVAWTDLVTDAAAFVTRHLPGRRLTVVMLLAAKVAWVGAGLTGALPGFLGGNAAVWRASVDDGVGSWVLGGGLAVLAVLAVSRHMGPSSKAGLPRTPLLLVLVVLAGPGLVAGALDVVRVPAANSIPRGLVDLIQTVAVLAAAAVVVMLILAADLPRTSDGAQAPDALGPGDPGAAPSVALPSRRTLLIGAADACLLVGFLAALLQRYSEAPALVGVEERLPFPDVPYILSMGAPGSITAHYFLAPGAAFVVAAVLTVRARRTDAGAGQADSRAWVVPATFAVALVGIALLYVLPHLPQLPLQEDPELAGATGDLLAPLLSHNVFPLEPAGWTAGWNGVPGTFHPVTFDAVLTVGLGALAAKWWRRPDAPWALLSFVVLASTALAHSSTVRPDGWLGNRWYYVGFVVPVVWQLLVRGDELNRLVRRHPPLAVLNLALVLLLLTVIGYRLLTGALDPTLEFEDAAFPYGRGVTLGLVLVPLGAVAVGRHLRERST